MNIEQLRAIREGLDPDGSLEDALADLEDNSVLVPVAESEVVGLAVELLKQRGASEVRVLERNWKEAASVFAYKAPGRYLVVPLDALEEQ